jgi:hypothetical protein
MLASTPASATTRHASSRAGSACSQPPEVKTSRVGSSPHSALPALRRWPPSAARMRGSADLLPHRSSRRARSRVRPSEKRGQRCVTDAEGASSDVSSDPPTVRAKGARLLEQAPPQSLARAGRLSARIALGISWSERNAARHRVRLGTARSGRRPVTVQALAIAHSESPPARSSVMWALPEPRSLSTLTCTYVRMTP